MKNLRATSLRTASRTASSKASSGAASSIGLATAFAPATVANVGVGFDILGFALEGLGERAELRTLWPEKGAAPGVVLEPVDGYPDIPSDPRLNVAGRGLLQLIEDKRLRFGFRVRLQKQIPIGSGLGGSATSAVAAAVAASGLLKAHLKKPLSPDELLHYAMLGEQVASGARHADNIAPCLNGGLVFAQNCASLGLKPMTAGSQLRSEFWPTAVRTPPALRCVIVLPRLSIKTKEARQILAGEVALSAVIQQTSNLAGFLVGCMQGDMRLIARSLRDAVIEPQRARLIPGFYDLQKAAFDAGALGCSLSGSGPAIFALAENAAVAAKVKKAMLAKAEASGLEVVQCWTSAISKKGARLIGPVRMARA